MKKILIALLVLICLENCRAQKKPANATGLTEKEFKENNKLFYLYNDRFNLAKNEFEEFKERAPAEVEMKELNKCLDKMIFYKRKMDSLTLVLKDYLRKQTDSVK
jgi:hypothetical protein